MTERRRLLPAVTFAQAASNYSFLWFTYLAQWGPPLEPALRTQGRVEHHERLHTLLDLMAEVEAPFADLSSWHHFLKGLPGYQDYWALANREAMYNHHAE